MRVIILELVVQAEVELQAEEDEGQQPLEDGGEPHLPLADLACPDLRAQSEEVQRREGSGDVLLQRGGQTQVSQHTRENLQNTIT